MARCADVEQLRGMEAKIGEIIFYFETDAGMIWQ